MEAKYHALKPLIQVKLNESISTVLGFNIFMRFIANLLQNNYGTEIATINGNCNLEYQIDHSVYYCY